MVSRNPSCIGGIIYNIIVLGGGLGFQFRIYFVNNYHRQPLTVSGHPYNPRTGTMDMGARSMPFRGIEKSEIS